MARSDFNWIPFTHTYTANSPSFIAEFRIEGDPIDDAYLLITAHNVSSQGHQIFINNQELPSWDIPIHDPGWQTWMDHIQPGLLHAGVKFHYGCADRRRRLHEQGRGRAVARIGWSVGSLPRV